MDNYPQRPKFWANRVMRAMAKTCAAQAIGHSAFTLVSIVAMTEDAGSYRVPVSWFNLQLMAVCGFSSMRHLAAARARAVESGWLIYHEGHKGQAGRYWVDIPKCFRGLDDAPSDESFDTLFDEIPVQNSTTKGLGKGSTKGLGKGSTKGLGKGSGKPPHPYIAYPYPNSCTNLPPAGGDATSENRSEPLGTPSASTEKAADTPDTIPIAKARPRDELFDVVAEVTSSDTKASGAFIGRVCKALRSADPPYTPDEVRRWAELIRAEWNYQATPTLGMLQKYIGRIRGKGATHARNPSGRNAPDASMRYDPTRDDQSSA